MYNILFLIAILGTPKTTVKDSVKTDALKEGIPVVVQKESFDLVKGIRTLYPSIPAKTLNMVVSTIKSKAHKYGFAPTAYPLIISMIMTESSFRHVKGSSGEVGMLQVIPQEAHIKKCVAKNIRCSSKDAYCKKNGKPDIYWNEGIILTSKVRLFLLANPKYALETGFCEMQWWKKRWHLFVKSRLWTYFPKEHLIKRLGSEGFKRDEPALRKWWALARKRCNDMLWVFLL